MEVKTLGGDEGVLGFAEQNDITVESAVDLDGAFEEGVEETQLHEDQNDGEGNTGNGDGESARIVGEVLPGQRSAHSESGHRGWDYNSSGGSARKARRMAATPEAMHRAEVRARTRSELVQVMRMGIWAPTAVISYSTAEIIKLARKATIARSSDCSTMTRTK